MDDRYLVTGATGCLGAWIVRLLVEQGAPVVALARSDNHRRLRLIATDQQLARVTFVRADVSDPDVVAETITGHRISHVIHCAALQVPFVRADPVAGTRVNVLGTVNVFEGVRRAGSAVRGLAYASSAAVYGPPEMYQAGAIDDDAPLYPERSNLYGVFKQANEGTAQIYASEFGIPSIGLRPFTVYGPGRDQGMTSTPTVAMAAAAAGRPYRISFGGPVYLNYAPDTAAAFIAASKLAADGAHVYNVPGLTATIADVVEAIEASVPAAAGTITYADDVQATPSAIDATRARAALGPLPDTPLRAGVADTIDVLKAGLRRGLVATPED